MRFRVREVNIRAQRLLRNAAFAKRNRTRHVRAAQPAADLNLDALRALAEALLDRAFHGAAITDAPFDLPGDIHRNQISVRIRRFDFLDLKIDLPPGQRFKALTERRDLLPLAPDQETTDRKSVV